MISKEWISRLYNDNPSIFQIILNEAVIARFVNRSAKPLVLRLTKTKALTVQSFVVVIYSVCVAFLFGAAVTESFTNIGKYSLGKRITLYLFVKVVILC